MKLRVWKIGGWMALLASAGLPRAQGAETAPPPVAQPGLSASLTNLARPGPNKDSLKQLEEELSKSLQPFSPRGSLDSILEPRYLPQVIIPNRRPGNEANRPANWPFAGPNDHPGLAEDPFKSLQNPGKRNSLEEIYNSLESPRSSTGLGKTKPESSARPSLGVFDLDDENSKLPSGIRETAKTLRDKLLGNGNMFDPRANRGTISDLFSPTDNRLSREQIEAHKEYMQRYRQTFDMPASWASDSQNPLSQPLGLANMPAKPVDLGTALSPLPASTLREGFAATPAALDSVLHPTALPDVNDRVINRWNPLHAAPAVELAKPSSPISPPMMEVPRRKF